MVNTVEDYISRLFLESNSYSRTILIILPKIKFCIELLYLKHEGMTHLRRIKTEERAKVVAAASGAELINFFAMLAILHQDDMMNRMN